VKNLIGLSTILVLGVAVADEPAKQPAAKTPTRVDNSLQKAFPPIIEQKGNSCAQVAGIYYAYTYEMNVIRGVAADSPKHLYPDHFTWNCLNNAIWTGSSVTDGWAIIQEMGIPTLEAYGDPNALHFAAGWPNGYDIYYRAMHNRVERYGGNPVQTPEDLEKVKSYLRDYNNPRMKQGGVLLFSLQSQARKKALIAKGEHEAGKSIVTGWGIDGSHTMVIVGYDDEVGYDFNGDGKITNDVDIDGDGKITLADWERGAFIAVDPQGPYTGDRGKWYVPYRLSALPPKQGGGGGTVWGIEPKEFEPTITLRLRFKFDDRSALRFTAGVAADPQADKPTRIFQPGIFNGQYKVGAVPLRGRDKNDPIEIGLDLSRFAPELKDGKYGKFFLKLDRAMGSRAKGEVSGAAILFYDKGKLVHTQPFEIGPSTFCKKPLELTTVRKP
jgi:hypothetical protein